MGPGYGCCAAGRPARRSRGQLRSSPVRVTFVTESSPSARSAGPVPGDPSAGPPAPLIAGHAAASGHPAPDHPTASDPATDTQPGAPLWWAGEPAAANGRAADTAQTGPAENGTRPGPTGVARWAR